MKSFYLNDKGDIELTPINTLKMIEEDDEVRQRNRLSLTTNKGEWFLNLNFGIPWIKLLGNKASITDIKRIILEKLSEDEAIQEIEYITIIKPEEKHRVVVIELRGLLTNKNKFYQTIEVS